MQESIKESISLNIHESIILLLYVDWQWSDVFLFLNIISDQNLILVVTEAIFVTDFYTAK